MSIIDDAADIIRPHIKNAQQEPEYSDDNDDHDIEAAAALSRAGMLRPKPQIIRTTEELDALDPETLLGLWHPELDDGHIFLTGDELLNDPEGWNAEIHFVVIATGDQVRAAEKALEADQ